MLKLLDNHNYNVASEIVKLQRLSYQIEANMIGYQNIPPLLESVSSLIESDEIFYGYYFETIFSGLISYKIEEDILDIYRVAVHPNYFRKGIAEEMIKYIEKENNHINKIIVSTGNKNKPAINLYLKLGFKKSFTKNVDGVSIIGFEKNINR